MKVFHREKCGAPLQPFFDWWCIHGVCDLTVGETGGNRDDADQLVEWAKGREVIPGRDPRQIVSWRIVNPAAVVTYAFTAEHSAHGHAAAADVFPVRTHFANGMPASIWLGNEKDPAERAEAERLQRAIVFAAKAQGLESGADFPHPDVPHLQAKGWRAFPRYVRPAVHVAP